MEKHHARLFVGHVMVDRDDVDRPCAAISAPVAIRLPSPRNRRRRRRCRRCRRMLPTCSRPCPCRSCIAGIVASAERELEHSVFRFSLSLRGFLQWRSSDGTFFRQRRCAEQSLRIADLPREFVSQRRKLFTAPASFSTAPSPPMCMK